MYKDKQLIITGERNLSDGLWDIPITKNNPTLRQHLNIIIVKDKTKQQLAAYLHACCFSPSLKTFIKAVKNGNFISWPGLDANLIEKHLTASIATAKGHLDQERKNLQSTKPTTSSANTSNEPTSEEQQSDDTASNDDDDNFFPPPNTPNEKTHDVLAVITPFKETNRAYSDQTGKFPYKSSQGNEYLLIVYDYDSNAILAEPLKNKATATIRDGWKKVHDKLASRGVAPKMYVLDNEISNEFKTALHVYKNTTYNTNVYLRIFINIMRQRGQSEPSRIIFWQS